MPFDIRGTHFVPGTTVTITAYGMDGEEIRTFSLAGKEDTYLLPFMIADMNRDSHLEVLVNVESGYSRGPRGIVIFDADTGVEKGLMEISPCVNNHPPVGGPRVWEHS